MTTSLVQRIATKHQASMTREACIVAAGQFGDSYCLFKNRDRNYIPEVTLYREVIEGVEVAYLYDDKTGWVEGMNEFGVGIVNAALMVSRDESERDEVERTGKKLSDGDCILRALQEKTVSAAAKSIQTYKGGLKGHTIISDGKTTMYVEHPKDDQESHGKVPKGEVFVRTNHGIDFSDAGYVKGTREDSSKKRQSQAEKILGAVKSAEDVAPAILRAREDRYEPTEMVRDHKNEKKMRTTSQMVMDLTHKKVILYLLPGKVKWLGFTDKMPKGRESQIEIEVVEYESLSVGTEGKVKKKASGLLPILDPAFNLREIFKQLVLLEDHLFQSRKRCPDCIWKHLLTAEALAEEALTLDENHKYTKLIEDTVVRIRSLQNALQDARPYDEIAQSARNIRKGLLPIASNVRVATRAIRKGHVTMFEDDMSEMHTTAHKVATQWLTSSRYKCVPEGMVLLDYVRGYKQISGIKRIPIAQVTEDHQTRIVVGLEDIVEQDLLIKGKPYMSTQKMEALFSDEVVIEEKVDGHPMVAIYQGYTFFCESLKVQHSVDYDACPYSQDGWPDMLVVYEIMDGEHSPPYSEGGGTGKWLSRNDKEAVCHMVGAPICPLVFQGRVDPEDVPALAQRLSSFGSSQAEGVVLKNLKKGIFGKFVNVEFQKRITDEDMWGGVHPEQRGLKNVRRTASVHRVAQQYLSAAAKYKDKKQVPKADGSGKTTVYVYSERQVQNRNRDKAERVDSLRHSIEDLRKQVGKDIDSEDTKTRLTALAVALIDATFERVGNEDSADDGHFGVTGWLKKHVSFSKGKATITYVGKSGVSHKKEVSDKKLVSALRGCCEDKKPDDTILSFGADDSEGAVKITSREVNTYLKPFDVTAKDLRGFHANRTMQDNLKAARKKGPKLPTSRKEKDKILKKEFKEALEATAEAVGHEPATLRTQYLVPGLEDTYMKDGTVSETLKDAAQRVAAQWLHATLSPAEKEDREYDRMLRKAPKEKPPRHDKRRTLVKDPTEKEEPQDKDQSKNCKDVGGC